MEHSTRKQNYDKLFQSVCLVASLFATIKLLANILLDAEKGSLLHGAFTLIALLGFYILSKYKDLTEQLFWPFSISIIASMALLWFSIGGTNGPAIVAFAGTLVVLNSLDQEKRTLQLGVLYCLTFIGVVTLEYLNPHWVTLYKTPANQFADSLVVGSLVIGLITIVSIFIRQRNDEDRRSATDQTEGMNRAKEEAEKKQNLLVVLKDMQSSFFLGENKLEESFKMLMDQLLAVTNSEFGYIGEVMYRDGKDPYLKAHVILDKSNPDQNQENIQDRIDEGNLHLLFKHVMSNESYIISDKIPVNRPELKALLGFPVMHHDKIVGMVGVANRGGYEEELVQFLTPFLSTYGTIIQNIRLQRIQKKYEEELFQAKEIAEQAVQSKDLFLTNISHELRTPLTLITGPVSSLLNQTEGTLVDETIRPSLHMIYKNSNKMLQFIEDIMDLAKLKANKLQVNKNVNNLSTFVEGVYSYFKIQTTYRQIDYQLDLGINKDLILEFDTRKVEKILNNLLSNAFKYTKDGGEIKLIVSEIGADIKIEVSDTGIGINEYDLKHVFDRFYQTSDNKKVLALGTGVGLALAQDLAQIQGFEIKAESREGKGSTFSFLIPKTGIITEEKQFTLQEDTEEEPLEIALTSVNKEGVLVQDKENSLVNDSETEHVENEGIIGEPSKDKTPTNKKPHLLIVEDNPDMREFVKSVLVMDYDISLAENGKIGLSILEEQHETIDLVITDLMMPEMDGFELMENIKAQKWGKNLPIIVLTAKTNQQSKLKALTIGVEEYLTKPFSVNELLIRVKNLIDNLNVRKEWQNKALEEQEEVKEVDKNSSRIDAHQESHEQSDYDRERIENAKKVVMEHIDDVEFTVDNLAKAVMMSKRQMYRFMQSVTGLTPLNFIKEIRLQEARILLEERKCSTVKEVSYSIGFMSSRHFTKNYLERFGKKPSQYFK